MVTNPTASSRAARDRDRQQVLHDWAAQHGVDVDKLDLGQQWVLYAALHLLSLIGAVAVLRRVLGYLLAHCGMGLSAPLIARVVGVSDRALRTTKALSPRQLVVALRRGGNHQPKLRAEHAGPLARFLVQHPRAHADQIQAFIKQQWKLRVDRTTLSRYLSRYGLGCLRQGGSGPAEPSPLLSDTPAGVAPSS